MRKMLLLLLLLPTLAWNQIDEVRRITEQLCSSGFHGRGYVNRGDSIAAAFLVNEFKKIGLEPLGKSYLQPFELQVNTFPGGMRVQQGDELLIPGKEYVVDPSSSASARTRFTLREIPVEDFFNPDALVKSVQGMIAKMRAGVPQMALCDLTSLTGDSLRTAQGLVHEISPLIPILEVIDTKFTWSVGRAQESILYVQVQKSALKNREEIEIEIEARLIPNYPSQNVVASLPSKSKCKKTIVFSEHYDHLGRMGADTYFPGANDNASGTAMLLSMAKHFKDLGCDYNLVFIAFAGEEAGLVGSKYFVEHPLLKLDKIEFLINLDIMGSGEEGITVVNATLFEEQITLLERINSEMNLLTKIKRRGPTANSDHYWFTEKGVPAFFIYTMGPNKHYHDVFDTYEELSFNEYADITTLLTEFVKRLKSK